MSDEINVSVELCTIICSSTSQKFNKDQVLKLLSSGADINFQDANRNFNTPLHLSIERKNTELVKLLLLFNPSLKIRNINGERPRDFALNLNYFDVVKALDMYRETSKGNESSLDDRKIDDKASSHESETSLEVQSYFYSENITSYTSSRVQFLLTITKIDPHYKRTSFDLRAVKQIYAKLDENVLLRPLLKVAKEVELKEIYFLYDPESKDQNHFSTDELNRTLFVCGPQSESEFLATLTKKLFHISMNHINDNESRPYRRKQNEKMIKFRKIVTIYKRRTETLHPKVQKVFELPEPMWDAEIIAFVPYFIAFFYNSPVSLTDVTDLHKDLFDFYFEVVLKDIDDFLVRNNQIRFKGRPVEGSSYGKYPDPYKHEKLAENYGTNYRHNKRNNRDLERLCSIL